MHCTVYTEGFSQDARWNQEYRTKTEKIKQAHPSLLKAQATRYEVDFISYIVSNSFLTPPVGQ